MSTEQQAGCNSSAVLRKEESRGKYFFAGKKDLEIWSCAAFPLCENLLPDNPFPTTSHHFFLRMGGWSQWANALLKEELPAWFNMYRQFPLSSWSVPGSSHSCINWYWAAGRLPLVSDPAFGRTGRQMGEGEEGREDGKQQRRPGLKKTERNSFHGAPPLLASCLAVAGAHLMCRQHWGARNLYGLDIHRNMPSTVVRDGFVLSMWETAWLGPDPEAVADWGNCLWSCLYGPM